jgi:murein biosynthesis integral membrane protein MurJ
MTAAEPRRPRRSLVGQASATSVIAMLAVLSGFVLDIVIAATYGAGPITDSFFVAARIPLGVWALAVAASNQALVPAFSTSLSKRSEQATWRLASILISAIVVGGLVLVGIVLVAARPLVAITAPGLLPSSATLAAELMPVTFALIPLVLTAEVLRALLNARFSFVVPAAINIALTGTAAAIIFTVRHNPHVIAWAYVAGGCVQVALIAAFAYRNGFRFRPSLRLRDEHFDSVARLTVRPIIAGGLNPVARLAEQALLSFLPAGSITIIAYGYRLISAVGGTVFFRSVMVTLLPRLSAASSDLKELNRLTRDGMRIMLALSVPLTVFVAVLAQPGAVVAFQRGRFTRAEALLLGTVIAVYATSLVGSALQRALQAPFFALLDTRTPLWTTVWGVIANLVALPLAVGAFKLAGGQAVLGVPIAFSIGVYVMAIQAAYKVRKVAGAPWRGLGGFTVKLTVASALAGVAMLAVEALFKTGSEHQRFVELAYLVVAGAAGLAALAGATAVLFRGEIAAARKGGRLGLRSLLRPRPKAPQGGTA